MKKNFILLPVDLLLAILTLLAGLWADLLRLVWILADFRINLSLANGPLKVSGFRAFLNRMVPYHPISYVGLVLLHTSLSFRIANGLGDWYVLRQWGGLFNEISILLFLAMLAIMIRSQSHQSGGIS